MLPKRLRSWCAVLGCSATVLGGLAAPGLAEERLALRVEAGDSGIPREGRFRISRPVEAHLVGQGSGARRRLQSYGWLIDADSRKLVWSMTSADPEEDPHEKGELEFDQSVELKPGTYSAFFLAQKHAEFSLKGLLHGLPPETGRPRLEIWLDGDDQEAFAPAPVEAEPGPGVIRLAPLGDDALARRRFRLGKPASVHVLAMGERSPMDNDLADQSWLLELDSRRVVWSLAREEDSRKAGGSIKNEIADRTLSLPAGAYELVAFTDDSHSWAHWNAAPPWNPGDWGVTLWIPPDALSSAALPAERIIVRLSGAGDEDSLSATFRTEREGLVRLAGIGEWSPAQGQLVDRGWIEPQAGGAPVWSMTFEGSVPAGGHSKNRAVDQSLRLPAGTWRARYITDDSHSTTGWNAARPNEPRMWGLTVSTFDPDLRFELLEPGAARLPDPRR